MAVGCFESKQDYTLNPDGSGKVVCEVIFQKMSDKPPSDADLQNFLRQSLGRCCGVDAWKDLAIVREADGHIRFQGTAYFKDLAALKIEPGGLESPVMAKDEKGNLVLTMGGKEEAAAPVTLSEEEIAERIAAGRAAYQEGRPMMQALLEATKTSFRFQLPAKAEEVVNLEKEEGNERGARLVIDGAKLVEAMDRLAADNAAMRELVAAGETLRDGGPVTSKLLNEKLFGRKDVMWVRMGGEAKPQFDYAAEVEAAKAGEAEMMKRLGLDPKPQDEEPPAAEEAQEASPVPATQNSGN